MNLTIIDHVLVFGVFFFSLCNLQDKCFILFLQGVLDQALRLRRRRWWRRTCRLGADDKRFVLLLFARRTPGEDYTFGVEEKKKGNILEGTKKEKKSFRI